MTPAGMVFPKVPAKFGAVSLPTFAILYFSILLGYVITPCPTMRLAFGSVLQDRDERLF